MVQADPVAALRDAFAQLEPRPDEIVVSTHPRQKSGWLRRNVVERMKRAAEGRPLEHVVVDLEQEAGGEANVLVVANETTCRLPSMWRSPPHPPHPPHRGVNPHRMRGRGYPASDKRLRHMAPQAVTWRSAADSELPRF